MKFIVIFSVIFYGVAIAELSPSQWPKELLEKLNNNIKPRVIGANSAIEKQIPYQVGISIKIDSKFSWCGGSVISNTWVITAAHCLIGLVLFLHYCDVNIS